jgi:2-dehydropantoate 2-reductase
MAMKVAVVGAGALGGLFGGMLARAGFEVVFLVRERMKRQLEQEGLQIATPGGEFAISPVFAGTDPSALGGADVVLVTVKAWQVAAVAPTLRPLIKGGTIVIPVQNGVEAADQLQADSPNGSVVGGVCHVFSSLEKPGRIVHKGKPPQLTLGELGGGTSARLSRVAEAFRRAEIAMVLSEDIRADIWEKMLFVEPLGSIGAATRASIDVFRSVPGTRAMLLDSMREVQRVSGGIGIALAQGVVDRSMVRIDSLPAGSTASMHRDIVDGRPSELEQQTGAVVRFAKRAGVAAPVHDYLLSTLLPQELSAQKAQATAPRGG